MQYKLNQINIVIDLMATYYLHYLVQIAIEDSKLPLNLHLMGDLAPVTMTDGTAISAIKLPLVRRLVSQGIPTIKVARRVLDSPKKLSLATALKRGWIDSRTGRLRSANGAVSQVNLLEAVEQKFVDPNSIVVRISGGAGNEAADSETRYYSLASVLDAANTIARAGRFSSQACWQNELLKTLMTTNINAAEGDVHESISPDDYNRLQSIVVQHGVKHTKDDKKLSAMKITLKPKRSKISDEEQASEKPKGEKMSLARAIQAGRFDSSTCTITTHALRRMTLKEAVEQEVIDEEISLIQDERTGHYRSLAHYLTDGNLPVGIWLRWPMATLLLPKEVESFGRRRLSHGRRIPYASAQALNLINPISRTVFNPLTENYVSILNAFVEGPLCGKRTVIYFRTAQEYLSVDRLLSVNPENVMSELLYSRSLCLELQEDINDGNDSTQPQLHTTIPAPADSKALVPAITPVDLRTALILGWVDRQSGFINDPFTGHRLLLKEAVTAGLIDSNRTVFRDPATQQISTLNAILKSGKPIDVPYILHLLCSENSQISSTQSSFRLNKTTSLPPMQDSTLSTTASIIGSPMSVSASNVQESSRSRFITEEECPILMKDESENLVSNDTQAEAPTNTVDRSDSENVRSNLAGVVNKVGSGLAAVLGAAAVGGALAYQTIKKRVQISDSLSSQCETSPYSQSTSGTGIKDNSFPEECTSNGSRTEVERIKPIPREAAFETDVPFVDEDLHQQPLETPMNEHFLPMDSVTEMEVDQKSIESIRQTKETIVCLDHSNEKDTNYSVANEMHSSRPRSGPHSVSADGRRISERGDNQLENNSIIKDQLNKNNDVDFVDQIWKPLEDKSGNVDTINDMKPENVPLTVEERRKEEDEGSSTDEKPINVTDAGNSEISSTKKVLLSPQDYLRTTRTADDTKTVQEPISHLKESKNRDLSSLTNAEESQKGFIVGTGIEDILHPESSKSEQERIDITDSMDQSDINPAVGICNSDTVKGVCMSRTSPILSRSEDSKTLFVDVTLPNLNDFKCLEKTRNEGDNKEYVNEGTTQRNRNNDRTSTMAKDNQKPIGSKSLDSRFAAIDDLQTQSDKGVSSEAGDTWNLGRAVNEHGFYQDQARNSPVKVDAQEYGKLLNVEEEPGDFSQDAKLNTKVVLEQSITERDLHTVSDLNDGDNQSKILMEECDKLESIHESVSENQGLLSEQALPSLENPSDSSVRSQGGFTIKKVLTNVGGILAAAVGAPVVAGVMAYNAAKNKLESRTKSIEAQNKPVVAEEFAKEYAIRSGESITTERNTLEQSKPDLDSNLKDRCSPQHPCEAEGESSGLLDCKSSSFVFSIIHAH